MSSESKGRSRAPSNARGVILVTQNIRGDGERISFRELARFARKNKTVAFLAERTGRDQRTAKRWLSKGGRAPDYAIGAVLADILGRLD